MAMNLVQFLELDEVPETDFRTTEEGKELLPERTMNAEVKEYLRLDKSVKDLKKRMDAIKDHAKTYAAHNGQETGKGHLECDMTDGRIQFQLRKSYSLNDGRAVEFCSAKEYQDCLETVVVVNEAAFEQRCKSGDVTREELEGLTDVKENRALYIKE